MRLVAALRICQNVCEALTGCERRKMRHICMLVAGLAALIASQAFGQPSGSASKEAERQPPFSLRTRIALPGVYGRMDHYGWAD
jgi:hypothetical protein